MRQPRPLFVHFVHFQQHFTEKPKTSERFELGSSEKKVSTPTTGPTPPPRSKPRKGETRPFEQAKHFALSLETMLTSWKS